MNGKSLRLITVSLLLIAALLIDFFLTPGAALATAPYVVVIAASAYLLDSRRMIFVGAATVLSGVCAAVLQQHPPLITVGVTLTTVVISLLAVAITRKTEHEILLQQKANALEREQALAEERDRQLELIQQRNEELQREIAERKRAEEALKGSEALYRAIARNIPDSGVFVLDTDLRYVVAEGSLLATLGVTREMLEGRTPAEVFGEASGDGLEEHLQRALSGETLAYEYAWDGRALWSHYTSLRDEAGKVWAVLVLSQDITGRRRAENHQAFLAEASEVLSSSLDYQATLRNITRLAVPCVTDWCTVDLLQEDGSIRRLTVRHADPASGEVAGVVESRYLPGPTDRAGVTRVLRTGEPELYPDMPEEVLELLSRCPEHLRILQGLGLSSTMIVPMVVGGKIVGTISFSSAESGRHYDEIDLSLALELGRRSGTAIENARLFSVTQEATQKAKEAVKARDIFLSVASHELRTPLTSLLGYSQILQKSIQRDGMVDPKRLEQVMGILSQQSDKLAHLINQLLDVSRIQTGRLVLDKATVDLAQLVRGVATNMLPRTKEHGICISAPEKLELIADTLRLEQVLTNLLDNAMKFSPDGGLIELVVSEPDSTLVQMAVTDHGVGVPPEHREGIFDQFYQAHRHGEFGGMGLGLFISRQIVELHGGTITAEFPEDGGTRFVVALPKSELC